jgi:hypothetical protein
MKEAFSGDVLTMEQWDVGPTCALIKAEECCQKFTEKVTTIEQMETRSTEAVELLTER